MDELKEVKRAVNPTEVLLVVDAMTGQEAAGAILLLLLVYKLCCFLCYTATSLFLGLKMYYLFLTIYNFTLKFCFLDMFLWGLNAVIRQSIPDSDAPFC